MENANVAMLEKDTSAGTQLFEKLAANITVHFFSLIDLLETSSN